MEGFSFICNSCSDSGSGSGSDSGSDSGFGFDSGFCSDCSSVIPPSFMRRTAVTVCP